MRLLGKLLSAFLPCWKVVNPAPLKWRRVTALPPAGWWWALTRCLHWADWSCSLQGDATEDLCPCEHRACGLAASRWFLQRECDEERTNLLPLALKPAGSSSCQFNYRPGAASPWRPSCYPYRNIRVPPVRRPPTSHWQFLRFTGTGFLPCHPLWDLPPPAAPIPLQCSAEGCPRAGQPLGKCLASPQPSPGPRPPRQLPRVVLCFPLVVPEPCRKAQRACKLALLCRRGWGGDLQSSQNWSLLQWAIQGGGSVPPGKQRWVYGKNITLCFITLSRNSLWSTLDLSLYTWSYSLCGLDR